MTRNRIGCGRQETVSTDFLPDVALPAKEKKETMNTVITICLALMAGAVVDALLNKKL